MTDIYIRRRRSSKGCLRVAAVVVVLLVIGVALIAGYRRARGRREEAESTTTDVKQGVIEELVSTRETPPPAMAERGPMLLAQAQRLRKQSDLLGTREACLEILRDSRNRPAREAAEGILDAVDIELILSPRPMPEKIEYTIKSGDTLGELAKKYGTTVDLIQKGNNVSGSLIRVGDRYRVLSGQFSITVDRSKNTLTLYLNDQYFKRYAVGTGKFDKTPTGDFKITDRIAQPTWWKPDGKAIPFGDKANVLGTHWLSLDIRGYGIHGTWEPDTIGRQASAGCIRLLNEEIEELYTLVPIGTPVTITE